MVSGTDAQEADINAGSAIAGSRGERHVFRVEFGERLSVGIASGFEEGELRSVLRILNQEVVSCWR